MLNTSIIIFTLITLFRLWHLGKFNKIIELSKSKGFLVSFVIICIFSIYMYLNYDEDSKEIIVLKKALLSMMIAFFASFDLIIPTFWIIWILGYNFDNFI